MSQRALIVDDEPDIRELLEITLGRMKIETSAAPDLGAAYQLLGDESFDLCLTDMNLPDGNGLELVAHINENHPTLPVAVITAFGSMDTAISALKTGAFDFVQKPVDLDELRRLVETALKIGHQAESGALTVRLTGMSPCMENLRQQIAKLARSQAPIYVSGESGSGKEVAARLIHEQGPRAEGPFVPVNCGAIPSELMESEFFGHLKGSFTGAVSDKDGLFTVAQGGTLFLDEVADLPLSMQVKLLRAIQEKAVRPVGGSAETPIDVRVLSATHKNLADEVAAGRFRQDLYYRLNVIELPMPSLRQRRDDIPELANQILTRIAGDYQMAEPTISDAAMAALKAHDFPGNVRELENMLERAFTLCENGVIEPRDLSVADAAAGGAAHAGPTDADVAAEATGEVPVTTRTGEHAVAAADDGGKLPEGVSLEAYLEGIERRLITDALEAARWNKTAAAKALGITFRALRYKLKKLDLE